MINEEDVCWIVNDLGELGVQVLGKQFFQYKGESLDYSAYPTYSRNGACVHEDGSVRLYRRIGKCEFGETTWPWQWMLDGKRQDRYSQELEWNPVLSTVKQDDPRFKWQPLPSNSGNEDLTFSEKELAIMVKQPAALRALADTLECDAFVEDDEEVRKRVKQLRTCADEISSGLRAGYFQTMKDFTK